MIHKLKRKFTVLATVSMFLLMTVLIIIMNLVNYSSVVNDSDTVLNVLSQPNAPFSRDITPPSKPEMVKDYIPHGMSPEVPYESRYFSVIVTPEGKIMESDLSKIISVDEKSAEEYISKATKSNSDRGFIGQFRYLKIEEEQITRLMFLDCGRKLSSFKAFMWTSIAVGLFGCLIVFILFLFVSGRIVKPIAESYEKQKRFISDAGHEIKTPLTIINANVDLLESNGEKEELSDIRRETKRLTRLTNDLVMLSKMEENAPNVQKIDFPVSDLVSETVDSFHALISSKEIRLTTEITRDLSLNASPDSVRQLVSILMENAIKYTSVGGYISVVLKQTKKSVQLSVINTTDKKINENDLKYVFDRFYRTDDSRNSDCGGHGIGLSIAKAIMDAHKGTIYASTRNGFDFSVTAIF